mmetsp:Transcript_1731/g.4492  ORF Transcript_1731/g.4492 Transcript_1731/m.4492 type:complete len:253 (-) Transcript_1731:55-813(-)
MAPALATAAFLLPSLSEAFGVRLAIALATASCWSGAPFLSTPTALSSTERSLFSSACTISAGLFGSGASGSLLATAAASSAGASASSWPSFFRTASASFRLAGGWSSPSSSPEQESTVSCRLPAAGTGSSAPAPPASASSFFRFFSLFFSFRLRSCRDRRRRPARTATVLAIHAEISDLHCAAQSQPWRPGSSPSSRSRRRSRLGGAAASPAAWPSAEASHRWQRPPLTSERMRARSSSRLKGASAPAFCAK